MLKQTYWRIFGRQYDWWARSNTYLAYRDAVLAELNQFAVPPGSHIYDPGGGCGQYATSLAERGYRVTVTDISSAMLAIGIGRTDDKRTIEWAVEDLSRPVRWNDAQFDAIVSVHAFFSVFRDLPPILREFYRVAKPRAPVLICGRAEPSSLADFLRIAIRRFGLKKAIADLICGLAVFGVQRITTFSDNKMSVFDPQRTPALFKEHGFEVCSIKPFRGYFSQHDVFCVLRRE